MLPQAKTRLCDAGCLNYASPISVVRFSLCERKTNNKMKIKYHSAGILSLTRDILRLRHAVAIASRLGGKVRCANHCQRAALAIRKCHRRAPLRIDRHWLDIGSAALAADEP